MSRSSSAKKSIQVRPDSKGRITLGEFAKGVSSFILQQDADGSLHLEPQVEIPAREKWLYENPEALASIRRGLADAKAGRVVKRQSYAKYAKEDDED
jgi:predicted transcriptional regulator